MGDPVRFVGSHPMAGSERSGGAAGTADLFRDRTWVLTPGAAAGPEHVERVRRVVAACGADPLTLAPGQHDAAVALVSHLPQLMASLVAGQLHDADAEYVQLAGQGVRDTTRIAASDGDLWVDILRSNAPALAPRARALADDLRHVVEALEALAGSDEKSTSLPADEAVQVLRDMLQRGRTGRARLPGKHGGRPVDFSTVRLLVPDRHGALAELFTAADALGVNIEDVSIDHARGHAVGVVDLYVQPGVADRLREHLRSQGWRVTG